MFNLVISIVAIVLVVVLTLATMYFGGDTVTKGREEAEIAQAVNELGQIKAALTAYNAHEGTQPEAMSDLVPGYLKSAPMGWGMDTPNTVVFEARNFKYGGEQANRRSCYEVNVKLGHAPEGSYDEDTSVLPSCNDLPANFYGCCQSDTPAAQEPEGEANG